MKLRLPLALALLALTAACAPTFEYRRYARPATFGDESTADINMAKPNLAGASRKVTLKGEGKLTVEVKATNGKARFNVLVYPEASATAVAEGEPPLEADGVVPGNYFIYVQPAASNLTTRLKINVKFDPSNPDQNSGADGNPETPNKLEPGKTSRGTVNYFELDRTDYFSLDSKDGGNLHFEFKPAEQKGKVAAHVQPPRGDWAPIDPRQGLDLPDAIPGAYLVRVQADEGGSASYTLSTAATAGDPDKNSGGDEIQEGATMLNFRPGTPPSLVATAKDEVDFAKGDSTDWFTFTPPEKGKCGAVLKAKNPAGKVRAEFVGREGQSFGERIRSNPGFDCGKAPAWIKVSAPARGDGSPYTLEVTFTPSVLIAARVLELDRKTGTCAVWVDKGAQDQVRQGTYASIVNAQGVDVATGTIDQVQPRMSHLKLSSKDCNFGGAQVQIQGGF